MSALTFKDLSTELTQAIESQLDTPSGTQARCTLGREKVMVLVEYPTETGQAEPLVDSTLDWLEQLLRQQFDTVGLPEEAADLSEAGEAVAVQLFLKHHSEPKPFTARSFTWKVADGFDDLFGAHTGDREDLSETLPPVFQDTTGSLSSSEAATDVIVSPAQNDFTDTDFTDTELLESEDAAGAEEAFIESESEESESDADLEDAFLPISAIENLDSEIFSLPGEEPAVDLEPTDSDLDLPTVDLPIAYAEGSSPSDEGFFDLDPGSISNPSTAIDSELAADFENALDKSAAQLTGDETDAEIAIAEDMFSELLDPELLDPELLDPENAATGQLQHSEVETWRFSPGETSPSAEANKLDQKTIQTSPNLKTSATQLADDNLAEDWIPDLSSLNQDETEPGEDIFESSEDETDESRTHEYTASEYEIAEDDDLSEEERYQLEQALEEDAPYEAVALVDEGEVQRQREQWQQQTKGNPWFFVGAIAFFAIGLLGFVLTRPCSFGACPRLETAQAEGERALSDLTLGADLKAVTAAKQQLNRSVRSLQPIPFWSPHYSEAKAVLPKFEGQLTALDRVSAAQSQAYEAALASQNPPHSSAKWEEIAQQWRGAIATLENVPTDNQVRRLADRKLTEYRANLSTIKVRIDAESQAEASLIAAQKAATLATATANKASSIENWESALQNWESAVQQIDQIPQGTLAYKEAQGLQAEYRQQMEIVRNRTLQERNASRNLSKAQQLASDAERVANEGQWTVAVQTWTAAVKQVQDVAQGTAAHATAQPLVGLYQQSLAKADSNRQVSLRFQPVEPSFYAACGATAAQRCTYAVRDGNVRLNISKDYDRAINQSITPPDQRSEITIDSSVVTQSNQLLKEITLLSTQGNFPIELYNAKGRIPSSLSSRSKRICERSKDSDLKASHRGSTNCIAGLKKLLHNSIGRNQRCN